MSRAVNDRRFSAEEVDSAIAALSEDPDRFEHAQQIVTHAAPSLHLLLGQAMSQGGWHEASEQQAGQIAGLEGECLSANHGARTQLDPVLALAPYEAFAIACAA